MPLALTVYIICALLSLLMNALQARKGNDSLGIGSVFGLIAAGAMIVFLLFGESSSGIGYYSYKVNGVKVASGTLTVLEGIVAGFIAGVFPGLIGTLLGFIARRKNSDREKAKAKRRRIIPKLICIYCLLGGIVTLVMVFAAENPQNPGAALLFAGALLLLGLLLLIRWIKD